MADWSDPKIVVPLACAFISAMVTISIKLLIDQKNRKEDKAEKAAKDAADAEERKQKAENEAADKLRRERKERIRAVVTAYNCDTRLCAPRYKALIDAGIRNLHSGDEARDAINELENLNAECSKSDSQARFLGPHHPSIVEDPNIDTLKFFQQLTFKSNKPQGIPSVLLRLLGYDSKTGAPPDEVKKLDQQQYQMDEPARKSNEALRSLRNIW